MRKLKVLELSGVDLVPFPHSIQLLHQLQTLCLDSYVIEDFTFLGKLKQLQALIIRKSSMHRLPKEIAELTNLRVLDLRTCDELCFIEHGILGSLTKLEELLLPKSFGRWDEGGVRQPINASLTELSNMPRLSTLSINIPDFTALSNNIPLVNLMRYSLWNLDTVELVDTGESVVHMNEARTLTLNLDPRNSRVILEDFVQTALQKAQKLHLSGWVGFETSVAALFKKSCIELKHIDVNNCKTIEYITDRDQQIQLPSLESLHLAHLGRLKKIGSLLEVPFGKLKAIIINECRNLRHLFSFHLRNKVLPVLEELEVVNCSMMQYIFIIEAKESTAVQGEIVGSESERLELKYLKKLKLENLPKMLSFCSNHDRDNIGTEDNSRSETELFDGRQVSFPCLESLTLSELPGFRTIAHHQHLPNLKNLKSLLLSSCESLSIAVGSELLAMLTNLEVLTIEYCSSMESVFEVDEESRTGEVMRLNEMNLIRLESLKRIWNGTPKNTSFMEDLSLLMIDGCNQLTYLFSPSIAKSLKNLSCLSIKNCNMMKGVLTEEMSSHECPSFGIPSLRELTVNGCVNMESFISFENRSEDMPIKESFFSSKVLLPSLERLVLREAGMFKSIWDTNISEHSFVKLTSVDFQRCNSVTVIFPSSMVERLQDLKEINVKDCSSVEVIFECCNENLRVAKLNRMRLEELPKLAHVVMSSSTVLNKALLGFPSLSDLRIERCDNLINLFDAATALTLSELQNLEIYYCRNMKEIVSDFEGDKNVGWKTMAFNKLFSLRLCNLDKLSHFCSGFSKLYFPVLKTFCIAGCAKFRAFVSKLANAVEQKDMDSGVASNVDNRDGVFHPLFDDKVVLSNLQHMEIRDMKLKEIWHDKFPSGSFCKLLLLQVEDCDQISTVIPFFMLHNLYNLEELTVKSCRKVEVIFQPDNTLSGRKLAKSTVCKLKKINLYNLPKLHSLYKSESFPEFFPFHKLESLIVAICASLTNLFTTSTAKILKKLEELTIRECAKLEVVVAKGIADNVGGPCRIVFPLLSLLELLGLPKLRSFCTEKYTAEWPSLKDITIRDCHAIQAFVADSEKHGVPLFLVEKESWDTNKEGSSSGNNKSGAFCQLKILHVESCSNLLTIFPSTIAGGFQNLEELTVRTCEGLREVFQVEDCNKECASDDNTCFEKLKEIGIRRCSTLTHVFPTSVARSVHRLSSLKIKSCGRIEEIVIRKGECNKHDKENACHRIMSFFPRLISLKLKDMPLLKSLHGGLHSTKWPLLQELEVSGCPAARILSSEQEKWNDNDEIYLSLEEKADNNIKIPSLKDTDIFMDMLQIPDEIVGNPTMLLISNIEDEAAVKAFPWRFLLERPHDLKVLGIKDCSFEEIFPWPDNGVDGYGHEDETDETVPFPYRSRTGFILIETIRYLGLFNLPKLKHVWKDDSALAHILDIVEILEVEKCNLLTGILCPSSSLAPAPASASVSFNHLKVLKISYCDELKHVMTASAARCLVHLTVLGVEHCESLEEIVTHDDSNGDQNERAIDKDNADVTFHQLIYLILSSLPSLQSFSSASCNFNFPYLVDLYHDSDPSTKKELFSKSKGIVTAPLLSEEERINVGIRDSME